MTSDLNPCPCCGALTLTEYDLEVLNSRESIRISEEEIAEAILDCYECVRTEAAVAIVSRLGFTVERKNGN